VPDPLRLREVAEIDRFSPDVVVEMAHPDYSHRWGERILQCCEYLPLSVTALADDALRERLCAQAQRHGHTLAIPHGALMGLDTLREWRHAWEEVTITFIKHRDNIDFSASGIDPAKVQPGTVVYDGPVRGIATRFPRNVNTMVTCALATVGLDRCRARLLTSESPNIAIADVLARGRDGSHLHMRKEQPAIGVSGTEMFESQFASILRVARVREPMEFV
jgi:aspartate dehydrogenase